LTAPGAVVLLLAIVLLGLMLAFNLQLRQLLAPFTGTARWVASTTAESLRRAQEARPGDGNATADANGTAKAKAAAAREPVAIPVRSLDDAARSILDEPAPRSGQSPMSQTVWTGATDGGAGATARPAFGAAGARSATAIAGDAATALESLNAIEWTLPDVSLLEPRAPARAGSPTIDHASNTRRIEEKLLSFSIPAKVVAVNSGPVVTQYEVRPEHHVKVSRIEALADDLAMALEYSTIPAFALPSASVVRGSLYEALNAAGHRPVRALQRLRGEKMGADNKGDFYVPPAPINALLSAALSLEAKIIAAGIDMPVGSSLLCLARKPAS
jgi:hypothetical protein